MSFTSIALVGLRESLEALLIIGILAGIARKAGAPHRVRAAIGYGAIVGLLASILLGILASSLAFNLSAANQELFEAVASFIAVAVLTYMAIWMYRHTRDMFGELHRRTKSAVDAGRPYFLAGIAFIAVLREGVETVLFTVGRIPDEGWVTVVLAIGVGIVVSAVLAFLIFAGIMRLRIERFMAATGLILIVMSAGVLVYGLHELSETGLAMPKQEAFDLSGVLPDNGFRDDPAINSLPEYAGLLLASTIGYREDPTWLELGAWLLYLAVMGTFWAVAGRPRRRKETPAEGPAGKPDATSARADATSPPGR